MPVITVLVTKCVAWNRLMQTYLRTYPDVIHLTVMYFGNAGSRTACSHLQHFQIRHDQTLPRKSFWITKYGKDLTTDLTYINSKVKEN